MASVERLPEAEFQPNEKTVLMMSAYINASQPDNKRELYESKLPSNLAGDQVEFYWLHAVGMFYYHLETDSPDVRKSAFDSLIEQASRRAYSHAEREGKVLPLAWPDRFRLLRPQLRAKIAAYFISEEQ